jgi:hypothetical protein
MENISDIITDVFKNLETTISQNIKQAKDDLNLQLIHHSVPGKYKQGRFKVSIKSTHGGRKSRNNRKTKKQKSKK